MRTKILVLSIALALNANLRAQVTIGELTAPAKGALLDLNKAVKGGLTLSNVKLDNLYTIPATFPGMSSPPADVNTKFTGAMVYHTGENNIPTGIYVWNGVNWTPAGENCTPLDASRLTLTIPLLDIRKGESGTFSASSDATLRCAAGETYTWSVSPAADIANVSGATTSIRFNNTGIYNVTVTVTSPYSSISASKTESVTVTTTGGVPANKLNYDYGIVGKTCLDVKKSQLPGQNVDAYNARVDDFEQPDDYTKTYKFLHTAGYSDLVLSCYNDPANILEAITTYPPESASAGGTLVDGYYEEEFTLKFKSNIKDLVPANGDSLTVKLVASYKPEGESDTKLAYLEIRVENGTCVCPAKISATEWKNFMCHNLGAEYDILSPSQLLTRAHHGDWYKFGAKNATIKNTEVNDAYSMSGTDPGQWGNATDFPHWGTAYADWPDSESSSIGNPCPAGWRLATINEWAAVTSYNVLTRHPSSWGSDVFVSFAQIGDNLYLPAPGYRDLIDGSLHDRGNYGGSWTSGHAGGNARNMGFGTDYWGVHYNYRTYGYSVRCVSAE
jgi:hypothetical protein